MFNGRHKLLILSGIILSVMSEWGCSDKEEPPTQSTPTPAISVADAVVAEGSTAVININLDRAAAAVVFQYASADVTAQAGSDYTAVSGTDTIQVGESSGVILVATTDDFDVEGAETFSLVLISVTGATVSRSLGTCTINDNDNAPVSYATDVQPLLSTSCGKLGTCHGSATSPGGGMFIGTNADYTDVIAATGNVSSGPVVIAGNSAASTLYTKTTDNYGFGSRMPQAAAALSLQQQATIRNWIDQGALDN